MGYFFRQYGASKALENLTTDFYIKEPSVKKELEAVNVVSANGKLLVPVIEEKNSNYIYSQSLKIVNKAADKMLETSFNPLLKELNFRSLSQTIIISYHEIMWDMLAMLVEKKIISMPKIHVDPHATEKDVAAIVFFVRKKEN